MRRLDVTTLCLLLVGLSAACSRSGPISNAYAPLYLPAGEPLCFAEAYGGERCIVSFISLVSIPKNYAGKQVQVIGFATLGFEGNALYLSKEAAQINDMSSAIWLDVEGLKVEHPQALNGKYVLLAGTFDAENRGHLGMFAGTIKGISRMQLWH